MSDYTCFKTEISNGVAHIIMSRGNELNTMTRLFWKELPELIKTIDKNADATTNKLVIISEFLSPIYFPKKPEIIDATSGRNKSEISILTF